MHVVIVGTAYPLRGGIAHFNALLAKYLRRNHSVEIITFKRQYPGIFFPGKSQTEENAPPDALPAPQLIDSINPLNWARVGRIIKRKKPDLVIFKYWLPFFGPCFGTIATVVKQQPQTKVLFICDNVIPHERRPGDVVFTRYAFKHVDYFIVQSTAVEEDLLKNFPHAVYRKVPHSVYENFGFALPRHQAREQLAIHAKRVILYFGYVRQYKGLMVLLEAMKNVREQYGSAAEILLLVVGEFYDDEKKYRDRVKELSLEDVVRFVPEYVSNQDVAVYFSASDVVVLPYLSATQSGIAQIAYNFDKPLIVTDVGGLAEIVIDQETGLVVRPNDPAELSQAIVRFYDENLEGKLVEGVRREKVKYSWEHFVQTIEELVEGRHE